LQSNPRPPRRRPRFSRGAERHAEPSSHLLDDRDADDACLDAAPHALIAQARLNAIAFNSAICRGYARQKTLSR
jgi:hypothetical protein